MFVRPKTTELKITSKGKKKFNYVFDKGPHVLVFDAPPWCSLTVLPDSGIHFVIIARRTCELEE